jgi:hypothetical protein
MKCATGISEVIFAKNLPSTQAHISEKTRFRATIHSFARRADRYRAGGPEPGNLIPASLIQKSENN